MQFTLLTDWLSKAGKNEIFDFHAYLSNFKNKAHSSQLWCAASIYMGFCSDDNFAYFKSWLIVQGKEAYTKYLENPDRLLHVFLDREKTEKMPLQWQDFLCIPYEAYEKLTGKDEIEDYETDYQSNVQISRFPYIELDWIENEARMRSLCPNIYDNFWNRSKNRF